MSSRLPVPPKARTALLVALCVSFGLATAASADWLVTTDGIRIETQGEWSLEGTRVIYTLPNGTLTSMRASQVDLEASRLANEPEPPPPDRPVERPQPRLILRADDVPRAPMTSVRDNATVLDENGALVIEEAGTDEASAATVGTTPVTETSGAAEVIVSSWNEAESDDGLLFTGSVENGTTDYVVNLELEARLFNVEGELVETRQATTRATALPPGQVTSFEVAFPNNYTYGEVRFVTSGRKLLARQRPADGRNEDEGEDDAGSTGAEDPTGRF